MNQRVIWPGEAGKDGLVMYRGSAPEAIVLHSTDALAAITTGT